jgi:hypothetical protein
MTEQTNIFQSVLDALLDPGKDFPRSYLQQFSDLGPLELKTLHETWPRIKPDRKLSLLEDLESLADEDTLVNFDDFARSILRDENPAVRVRALRLLTECEDEKLVPVLLDLLKNDPDIHVRAQAADGLGLFVDLGELEEISAKTYRAVEAGLLESAKGTDDARVRRRSLESLGWSSNKEEIELIESYFEKDEIEWKVSALTAMGRSADDRWEDRVLRSIFDDNDKIRKAAVQSAGLLSLKSARLPLLRMLDNEDNGEIMSAAIWSLSQIGGEDVQVYIENLIDSTDDDELIEFLEEALDNLAFTEDLDRFELMSFDPDEVEDLEELEGLEDLEKLEGTEDE